MFCWIYPSQRERDREGHQTYVNVSRHNVTEVQSWLSANGLSVHRETLEPLVQASHLLQSKKDESNLDTLCGEMTSKLKPKQVNWHFDFNEELLESEANVFDTVRVLMLFQFNFWFPNGKTEECNNIWWDQPIHHGHILPCESLFWDNTLELAIPLSLKVSPYIHPNTEKMYYIFYWCSSC